VEQRHRLKAGQITGVDPRTGTGAPPDDAAWAAVHERIARQSRVARGRKTIGVVTVALALTAGGLGLAGVAFYGHPPLPTPHPPLPTPLVSGSNGPLVFVRSTSSSQLGVDNTEIEAASSNGIGVTNLTRTAAAEDAPAWSADGTRVAFLRQSAGLEPGSGSASISAGVFTMSADGSNLREILRCPAAPCRISDLAWSPDAARIAFIADASKNSDGGVFPASALEVMNSDGSGRRVLCTYDRCDHAQGIAAPAWSPDGTRIAFSNQGVSRFLGIGLPQSWISVIRADGTGLRKLTEQNCRLGSRDAKGCSFFDSSPAWSPDGAWVAFSRIGPGAADRLGPRGSLLEIVRPDGTSLRTLDTCLNSDGCAGEDALAWSPDGKRIAYAGAYNSWIQLVKLDGSGRVTLKTCGTQGCVRPTAPVWSPDGRQLAFLENAVPPSVYVLRLDGSGLHRVAADVRCCLAWLPATSGVVVGSPPAPPPTASPSLGPEPGLIAFAWDRASPNEDMAMDIYTIRTDGSHLTRLTDTTGFDGNPVWSPDGTMILFQSDRPGVKNTNVFVMNAAGSDQRALTDFSEGAGPARWAPDGRQIVFSGGVGGGQAIFVMPVSGGTPHQLTQPNRNGGGFEPSWSPDGSTIAFSDDLPGGAAIYLMAPDGSNLRRLANLPGSMEAARWLPGSWLAFSWFTSAGRSAYEIRLDGTGLRRLQGSAASSWYGASSPDGTEIVFSRQFGLQREALFRANADGSAPQRITKAPGTYSDPAWQPVP